MPSQQTVLPSQQSGLFSTDSPEPPRAEMSHAVEINPALQRDWDADMMDMLDDLASGMPCIASVIAVLHNMSNQNNTTNCIYTHITL